MKYIKTFEYQSYNSEQQELQNFCNNHLAYLIDSGIDVEVILDSYFSTNFYIILEGYDKNWGDIKDDFIPFFEVLTKKYNVIHKITFGFPFEFNYNSNDIIQDKVPNSINVNYIKIIVKLISNY